jgi:hypothetical protein
MILQYITPAGPQDPGPKIRDSSTIKDETSAFGIALEHLPKEMIAMPSGVRRLIL